MANWADLPEDLLERIFNSCFIPDQIRMQLVCKSWRLFLKYGIPPELPWLMTLPNSSSSNSNSNKEEEENPPPDADACLFYNLSKQKIHTIPLPEIRGKRCCGSFQNGWLMIVDDKFNTFLFHPWSKRKIDLPHQSTFEDQIIELGIAPFDETHDNIVRSAMSDDGNAVMAVFGIGDWAFCRVGDAAYTYIDSGLAALIEDVIYHKGQFYALSHVGAVYLLHTEEGFPPRGEKLTLDSPVYSGSIYRYLVADILTDSMFVITRKANSINNKTFHFDIYRVSLEEGSHDNTLKTFTKVESLGDRVVFLGYNSPMIVMASQFPGLKGNCIYFTDMDRCSYSRHGCPDLNLGVFSLEDGTVEELFADGTRFHPTLSPPIWIAAPPLSFPRDFGREVVMLGRTASPATRAKTSTPLPRRLRKRKLLDS